MDGEAWMELRVKARKSRAEWAELAGISAEAVRRVEVCGVRPRMATLRGLEAAARLVGIEAPVLLMDMPGLAPQEPSA